MIISAILILCLFSILIYGVKFFFRGNIIIGIVLFLLTNFGIFLVLRPEYSTIIANYIGVGRGADLLLYLFFVLTITLILLAHGKFRRQGILITEIARAIAIKTANSHNLKIDQTQRWNNSDRFDL